MSTYSGIFSSSTPNIVGGILLIPMNIHTAQSENHPLMPPDSQMNKPLGPGS